MNSDLYKPQSKIHDFMSTCNLSQIISEPTRIPSNTLIDVILTNAPRMVIRHGVLDPLCSDHKPIFACINSVRQAPSVYKRLLWDFNNSNFDLFREKLEEVNISDAIDDINDVDKSVQVFTETFMEISKLDIDNKTVTIRNRDKPWMHNKIRKQIRIRNRIHKTAKRVNTRVQWALFRHQRNKVAALIKHAKQTYYQHLSEKLGSAIDISSKEWWKLCKFIYTGKTGDHSISQLVVNDNVITKDEGKLRHSMITSIQSLKLAALLLKLMNHWSIVNMNCQIYLFQNKMLEMSFRI